MIYRGVRYETEKRVALKSTDTDQVFGVILVIITSSKFEIMLAVESLETVRFDHFHLYEVRPSSSMMCCCGAPQLIFLFIL